MYHLSFIYISTSFNPVLPEPHDPSSWHNLEISYFPALGKPIVCFSGAYPTMSSAQEMDKFAAKSALRSRIKIALKQLKFSEKNSQSVEVTKKVLGHPRYQSSEGIAVFLSLADEIDTSSIVRNIFDSGKRCYIPRFLIQKIAILN